VHAAFGLVLSYAKDPVLPHCSANLLMTRDDASGLIGKKGSVVADIRNALGGANPQVVIDWVVNVDHGVWGVDSSSILSVYVCVVP
jgi:hypothetical protein